MFACYAHMTIRRQKMTVAGNEGGNCRKACFFNGLCGKTGVGAGQRSARIRSLAFSAIITTGALVLPETSVGMIEQSTARNDATP